MWNVTKQIVFFALSTAMAVCAFFILSRRHQTQKHREIGEQNGTNATPSPPPDPAEDTFLNRAQEEKTTLDELEKAYILRVLEHTEGSRTRTAKILGIARRTLFRKLEEYGISEEDI